MMKVDPQPPTPVSNATLICDHAMRDENGKVSLIGIFEMIHSRVFPSTHPLMTVYMKITGAEGKYIWRFELVRLEDDMVVAERVLGEATYADRLATHEVLLSIGLVTFEKPGRYEYRIYGNLSVVGTKTFQVVPLQQTGG